MVLIYQPPNAHVRISWILLRNAIEAAAVKNIDSLSSSQSTHSFSGMLSPTPSATGKIISSPCIALPTSLLLNFKELSPCQEGKMEIWLDPAQDPNFQPEKTPILSNFLVQGFPGFNEWTFHED
jgi:hypothetical protein